jgi:hypothetical protein
MGIHVGSMRRARPVLTCALLAVSGTLVMAGTASAAVLGQTYTVRAAPAKQQKKVYGPVGPFFSAVDTRYDAVFAPPGDTTVLTYPRDIKFVPGNIPECPGSQISTVPEAQAEALCSTSRVGSGSAVINNGALTGKVAAYAGTPTNGQETLLLHTDVFTAAGGYAFSTTLTGLLDRGPNTLTVSIPPTGTVITHFDTTINRIKTGKKSWFIMARCKKRKWVFSETTRFDDGSSITATSTQKCKQKKAKRKKK